MGGRLFYELGQDGCENYASFGCHVVAIFLLHMIYELILLVVFLIVSWNTGKWVDDTSFLIWPTIFGSLCFLTWCLGPMGILAENYLLLSMCSIRSFFLAILAVLSTFIHLVIFEGFVWEVVGWIFVMPGFFYVIGSYYSARSGTYFLTRYTGYDAADPDLMTVLGKKPKKTKKHALLRICDLAYGK
ncbi:unnamed protein product, partial [Mesorhabditis belari]|uniref:Uncharacterized protein n=1 Tax=Mesorhabditis belari TaxID=2138241 RepID=A0AAF3FDF3_9BILA